MRRWILDKDQTPQRFPLQQLLRRVITVAGIRNDTCELLRARGYGAKVRYLEERLDSEDVVSIAIADLEKLTEGTDEWFYDLEVRLPGTDLRFGLHDSTALFVDGDPSIVEKVVSGFVTSQPAL